MAQNPNKMDLFRSLFVSILLHSLVSTALGLPVLSSTLFIAALFAVFFDGSLQRFATAFRPLSCLLFSGLAAGTGVAILFSPVSSSPLCLVLPIAVGWTGRNIAAGMSRGQSLVVAPSFDGIASCAYAGMTAGASLLDERSWSCLRVNAMGPMQARVVSASSLGLFLAARMLF